MEDNPTRAREYAINGLREQLVQMGCDPETFTLTVDGEPFTHEVESEPLPRFQRFLNWIRRVEAEEPEVYTDYGFAATAREAGES